MAIADGYKANFETLKAAFANGDVALMECSQKIDGKPVVVLCMVQTHFSADGVDGHDELEFVPIAKLFDGDPYEELNPPKQIYGNPK